MEMLKENINCWEIKAVPVVTEDSEGGAVRCRSG